MTRFAVSLFKLSRTCARGTAPGAEAKLQSQCSCWEQAAGEGGAAQGGLSQRLRLSQPKDHVQGGRRAEPGRHRGLAGGILAASAPMALVTQHQIQKVRSRWEAFLGKRSVSPARAVRLLVRHGCYLLVLAGSSGDLLL